MELVDIYNDRHEKLNYQKDRNELVKGEYRLSSFIWVINDNNQILLQQRLASASKMPNMWGTTAGAVQKGETSLEGAIRELKEELGIDVSKEELEFIGSYKRVYDYIEVWLCKKNISESDLSLQKDEVQDAKWYTIEEFHQMIIDGDGIPTSFEIFRMHDFYKRNS